MCQTGSSSRPPATHQPNALRDNRIRASSSISRQAHAKAATEANSHSSRAGTSASHDRGPKAAAAKGV
nr:hypothetical protein [Kineosporia sp. NBRC 101677]